MASIAELCWTHSEELFRDVDLDALFERQHRTLRSGDCTEYPYLILVYTGKVTIGLELGNSIDPLDIDPLDPLWDSLELADDIVGS
jgi:hypothetical protein